MYQLPLVRKAVKKTVNAVGESTIDMAALQNADRIAREAKIVQEHNDVVHRNFEKQQQQKEYEYNRFAGAGKLNARLEALNQMDKNLSENLLIEAFNYIYLNSLPHDPEFIAENCAALENMGKFYMRKLGGMKYLKSVAESTKQPFVTKLYDVIEAQAKKLKKNKAKKIMSNGISDKEAAQMVAGTIGDKEKDELIKNINAIGADELTELVKQKVITVVKDEHRREKDERDFRTDLKNDLLADSSVGDDVTDPEEEKKAKKEVDAEAKGCKATEVEDDSIDDADNDAAESEAMAEAYYVYASEADKSEVDKLTKYVKSTKDFKLAAKEAKKKGMKDSEIDKKAKTIAVKAINKAKKEKHKDDVSYLESKEFVDSFRTFSIFGIVSGAAGGPVAMVAGGLGGGIGGAAGTYTGHKINELITGKKTKWHRYDSKKDTLESWDPVTKTFTHGISSKPTSLMFAIATSVTRDMMESAVATEGASVTHKSRVEAAPKYVIENPLNLEIFDDYIHDVHGDIEEIQLTNISDQKVLGSNMNNQIDPDRIMTESLVQYTLLEAAYTMKLINPTLKQVREQADFLLKK